MDQLFAFIGDVGGDLRDLVQDREQGKVSLEGEVHLGEVEHCLGIFPVSHLLLRERESDIALHRPTRIPQSGFGRDAL